MMDSNAIQVAGESNFRPSTYFRTAVLLADHHDLPPALFVLLPLRTTSHLRSPRQAFDDL